MFNIISSNDKTSGTNGNCVIHLNQKMNGYYGLYSFIFTNSLYNVNSSNNRFVLTNTNDSVISNVLLDEGYFTGTELANKIASAISNMTVEFDDNTSKFKFTYSQDFKLPFASYSNTCYALLGFEKLDYTSAGEILNSTIAADFNPHKNLFITINVADKPIENNSSSAHHKYTFMISDSLSSFGSLFRYIQEDKIKQQSVHIDSTRSVSIQIHDDENNSINTTNWIMILERK